MKLRGLFLYMACVLVVACSVIARAAATTITMVQFDRMEEAQWQNEVVGRFHEYQDSIRVDLISLAGARRDKMLTMAAAGTPPHIGYDDPPWIVSWAKQGIVRDLTPYLRRDSGLFEPFWPVLRQLATVDGKEYAIPLDFQITGLFYNTQMFEEAGLAAPWDGMRWGDILEFGPKLVKGHDGVIDRWAVQFPRWLNWWWVMWAYGADFFDNPTTPTMFTGDSPAMQAALGLFYEAIHESGVMAPRKVSQSPHDVLLVRRNVAMSLGQTINIQDLRAVQPTGGWNVARHPYGPAGNPAEVHGLMWFLFDDTKHADEAWKVLTFFSSEPSLRLSMEMRGVLVPHRRLAQLWVRHSSLPENRSSFIDALDDARGLPAVAGGEIRSAIEKSLFPFVDGLIPMSQVIADWRAVLPGLARSF